MIKIGIICPSEIASRRFLPSLKECPGFQFVGVAVAIPSEFIGASKEVLEKEREKAQAIVTEYGGSIFQGYQSLIESADADAIYLPLPPGLHYHWASLVLSAGKHALVEKPCTTSLTDTQAIIDLARKNNLALHENYMFTFHAQMSAIRRIVESGQLGQVRLYRISFGFPLRPAGDFRFNRSLGGGALLDCAGYTMKCASFFLGDTASVVSGMSNRLDGFEVDMYGSATMVNAEGAVAQLGWGMDNNYRCELDIWGSKGSLHTDRIMTAPAGYVPYANVKIGNDQPYMVELPADNAFSKSIGHFQKCIEDDSVRESNYDTIFRQAALIEQFSRLTR